MNTPLVKEVTYPHFILLKASAGSGKTHALTKRFVHFLLSNPVPSDALRSILAITFSNNAAKEMKERVLLWLKALYFMHPEKISEIKEVLQVQTAELSKRSGGCIDEILKNYSDFQIKTIDSFMAMVCSASAIDIGINPDFDILIEKNNLLKYAFHYYLRTIYEGSPDAKQIMDVVRKISSQKKSQSTYLWNPSVEILNQMQSVFNKQSLCDKEVIPCDYTSEKEVIKDEISLKIKQLNRIIDESGLKRSARDPLNKIYTLVTKKRFEDLITIGMKHPPVLKPKKNDTQAIETYSELVTGWQKLEESICQYAVYSAYDYYTPYLSVYDAFIDTLLTVKKQHGKIFIEDINKLLNRFLKKEIIFDVYYKLGEKIFHYLIDEFQDTSPLQWSNLFPLVENSLAEGGSLFAVGDTKQAIYGFRDADYRIMKEIEQQNPFPSASFKVMELPVNYRSVKKIQDFNDFIFKTILPNSVVYGDAAKSSGLTDYQQKARVNNNDSGYVEVTICEKDRESPKEAKKICGIVDELIQRGYSYGDIAVLTIKNDDVIRITTWLNEQGIDCLSYSSLDVRGRKITNEILGLLNFLNSPLNDLSFSTFLLGEIFLTTLQNDLYQLTLNDLQNFIFLNRDNKPYYKAFQNDFPELWDRYFKFLFQAVGYMPLYDLICYVYNRFQLFNRFKDFEEAGLVKILEVIKDFEDKGNNNIKDFLSYAQKTDLHVADWAVNVPQGLNKISVMTTHKAKGLGFPVVIVLLYGFKSRGFSYTVSNMKRDTSDTVAFAKITKDISTIDLKADARDELTIKQLYEREKLSEMVNYLNGLYVGFTRPMSELYVIGVKGEKDKIPFDILPVDEYMPKEKPLPASCFDKGRRRDEQKRHYLNGIEAKMHSNLLPGTLFFGQKRLGNFIHQVLFHVETIGKDFDIILKKNIAFVQRELREDYNLIKIEEKITRFIFHEKIKPIFTGKPGRRVLIEQEFVDKYGMTHRPDRVLIDTNGIIIVDYKTGSERNDKKYIQQLKRYILILKDIFPKKPISGVIAYMDPVSLVEVH